MKAWRVGCTSLSFSVLRCSTNFVSMPVQSVISHRMYKSEAEDDVADLRTIHSERRGVPWKEHVADWKKEFDNPRNQPNEADLEYERFDYIEMDGITRPHYDPTRTERIRKQWAALPDYLWQIEQAKPIHYRGHLEDTKPKASALEAINPSVARVERYISSRERFTKNKDYFIAPQTMQRVQEEKEEKEKESKDSSSKRTVQNS